MSTVTTAGEFGEMLDDSLSDGDGVNMWEMDFDPNDLRQRVAAERERRGRMSVREASMVGGISNTTWGSFEAGDGNVTKLVRRGVAKAFDWPNDWPENPPPMPLTPLEKLQADIDRMGRDVSRLQRDLDEEVEANRLLRGSVERLIDQVVALVERLWPDDPPVQ